MMFGSLRVSRRSLTIAAACVGLVSLGLGAQANKRPAEPAQIVAAEPLDASRPQRLALVIGNGHYPDAASPLRQPLNDARALAQTLGGQGFDVELLEDATRDDMLRAVERLKRKVRPQATVMVYFGGYGIQAGRESYLLPVDAKIWKESDVRRSGVSVEAVLTGLQDSGAQTRLAVVDASRRNPYERRFRGYSHGLAPIGAADNAMVLSSTAPGKVIDDADGPHSPLATELTKALSDPMVTAEAAFTRVRLGVIRATGGVQTPSLSSSLRDDVALGVAQSATAKAGS